MIPPLLLDFDDLEPDAFEQLRELLLFVRRQILLEPLLEPLLLAFEPELDLEPLLLLRRRILLELDLEPLLEPLLLAFEPELDLEPLLLLRRRILLEPDLEPPLLLAFDPVLDLEPLLLLLDDGYPASDAHPHLQPRRGFRGYELRLAPGAI
eukprot:CAMPEP_0183743302 /NCGR_PEP_ID=MMETSP0737-20130205/65145_2 /TAXON_ID=385413 /ORGANISM="Thalassiosira miniscula, Strain CCMP1093" /LENGTH=151 /DNA_ID=CAMNT_0025978911 /DNA_START=137 /DNA_END=593 /DNA_ORIENTATION=-